MSLSLPRTNGSRRPLAHAIERDTAASWKGLGKESAGSVALVVLGEKIAPLELLVKRLVHLAGQVDLFLQPDRHRLDEAAETLRRVGEVGLEQAFELEQRLVVKDDVIEIGGRDASPVSGHS